MSSTSTPTAVKSRLPISTMDPPIIESAVICALFPGKAESVPSPAHEDIILQKLEVNRIVDVSGVHNPDRNAVRAASGTPDFAATAAGTPTATETSTSATATTAAITTNNEGNENRLRERERDTRQQKKGKADGIVMGNSGGTGGGGGVNGGGGGGGGGGGFGGGGGAGGAGKGKIWESYHLRCSVQGEPFVVLMEEEVVFRDGLNMCSETGGGAVCR
ncbi:hypothetical protein MAR_017678 [Mya arenaria]|uniref:Uncharacterized protein n=1 Tax=Mya arenaria TaxID=6604 RepID=A0ABY7EF72_MYAAR|nr:hypothetical protein MAR_017678 [Mya arenaria]